MSALFDEDGVVGLFVSRARYKVIRLRVSLSLTLPQSGGEDRGCRASAADLGTLVAIVPRRKDTLGMHVVEDT